MWSLYSIMNGVNLGSQLIVSVQTWMVTRYRQLAATTITNRKEKNKRAKAERRTQNLIKFCVLLSAFALLFFSFLLVIVVAASYLYLVTIHVQTETISQLPRFTPFIMEYNDHIVLILVDYIRIKLGQVRRVRIAAYHQENRSRANQANYV